MLTRVALLSSVLVGIAGPVVAQAAQRVDVPITQSVLSNGEIRYSVPVSIGGRQPLTAMLDTGSYGLRVMQAAVPPGQVQESGSRSRFGFASGSHFNGAIAQATVAVGPLATDRPVSIQVVDKVDCGDRTPNCPAARVSTQDFRMGGAGLPNQGFDAILGVSMRRSMAGPDAENPLNAMGDESWIVVLPQPGSDQPGHLIVNPTPQDRVGFTTVRLQPQAGGQDSGASVGWRDGMLPGCLLDESGHHKLCGKTLIDTGAPGFSIDSAEATGRDQWAQGTRASFEIEGASQPVKFSFVTGPDWSTRVKVRPAPNPDLVRISAGTQPYFAFAVLYDARSGTIGFKPRDGE